MEAEHPSYKITTIKELLDLVTMENVERLIPDIVNTLYYTAQLKSSLEGYYPGDGFTWIDDGETNMKLDILNNETNELMGFVVNEGGNFTLYKAKETCTKSSLLETENGKTVE